MTTLLFWIAAACALAYLPLTARPAGTLRSMLKTASVVLLAGVAILASAPWLLILALTFCAIGDALLSRETDSTFMAGIGAFAAGHLAYIALFLTSPSSNPEQIFDHPAIFWSLIILGIVMATLLTPRAGDLKSPSSLIFQSSWAWASPFLPFPKLEPYAGPFPPRWPSLPRTWRLRLKSSCYLPITRP